MALLSGRISEGSGVTGFIDLLGFDYAPRPHLAERLDLIAVAEAHVLWKTRLGHHVQGITREPLESSPIGQDGICQLGYWIEGSAFQPLRDTEAYKQLKESHQQFHRFGAIIVQKLKLGERNAADAIFRNEYSTALRQVIQALTEINKLL